MSENDPPIQEQPEDVPVAEDDGAQHLSLHIRRLLPTRRIDKYLRHRFSDFSRTLIQRLIEEQAVTVNQRPTKSSYQLNPGDRIDLILPPPPADEIEPEPIPLDVLYEDEHLLVINKQADLIVHPARGNQRGTLVNGLVHYSNSLSHVNERFRPGIVHRLDRNTSGVLVVARTDTAHWRLAHQFEHRQVQKMYLAVVHGTVALDADVIDMPLGRHPRVREKYAARPESGKSAITRYERQTQYRGYAVMRLFPRTGRTHQLRVHLQMIKHPIVADTMYGGKAMTLAQLADGAPYPRPDEPGGHLAPDQRVIERQALHAMSLTLHHPISGRQMCFEAPPPPDMELLIRLLERYRKLER
ncbi:MAG: RluA family pseudouridine synthase [Sedimentisphaerales bacterium]|nr:RluA family pseudouridine synthase [Sedimentisphaerales bacterium]